VNDPDLLAGRYRLDESIGHGGMAVVFRAFDTVLERPVAIKYFQTHLMRKPVLVERFRREALAAAKIAHPNVVAVHDVGTGDDDRPFIVMELVAGPSLAELLKAGPLPDRRAARIGADIARGLAAAHAFGFVHRDVKPANVILTADDVAKLTDFGLVLDSGEESPPSDLTTLGEVLGSAAYVAPEQARYGESSAASDLYALGCTLYEAVAGSPPFGGTTAIDQAAQRLVEAPEPVALRAPGIEPALAALIMELLVRDPARRRDDAGEVGDELAALGAEGPD
jgi:serine/threonine-protein kinase